MSSPSTSEIPTARPRKELVAWRNAVFVVFVLSGLSLASWIARIPDVRDRLGLSTGDVGLLILGMSAGAIVGLIVAPPLLLRVGARHGIVLAIGSNAVGLVLIGLGGSVVGSVPMLSAGLVILGLGNGSVDVMMNVEGAAAERELGKTVMPLMHACFSIGTVVAAGVGAWAAGIHLAVAWHLIGMAIILVVAVTIAVRFIPPRQDLSDELPAGPDRPPWRTRVLDSLKVWSDVRLILIGAVMLGMAFAEGSANDWLPLAVVDGHGQTNATGAVIFGVFVAAMTVGRVAGGPVVDRFGRVVAIRLTAALGIAGLLIFIFGTPIWLVVIGTVLWGFGASLGFPLGMSAAADDGKNAAARVSAVAMIGYCAFLVGPPLVGFLGETFGLLNALFVVLALMVVSGICSGAVRKRTT